MRRTYERHDPSQAAFDLAEKITALVENSAVTIRDVLDALDITEEVLETKMRPVILK